MHLAVGLGIALQACCLVLPPLRALLGLVPVSGDVVVVVAVLTLLTWAVAQLASWFAQGVAAPSVRLSGA